MKTITKQKFMQSPLIKIILGLLICFAAFILAQQLTSKILDFFSINKDFRNLIRGAVASFAVLLAYKSFYQKIEKRDVVELSGNGSLKNISLGILIGTVLQCLTILVICIFGNFQIISVNSFYSLITPFSIAFSVAIFEEILLRGIIFRITEEKLGSYVSLILSGVIFGAVHLMNPSSTLLSSLCIGLVGIIFGASYIYSRSLWLPIAIHFSWNFLQSGIFGAVTSGNEKTNSLFNTQISGSELITGGDFGPEGTIQATLLWLIVAILLMVLITKQNKLIKQSWKKDYMIA
jgi:membrane protease YdiL (CAAX protease family)